MSQKIFLEPAIQHHFFATTLDSHSSDMQVRRVKRSNRDVSTFLK